MASNSESPVACDIIGKLRMNHLPITLVDISDIDPVLKFYKNREATVTISFEELRNVQLKPYKLINKEYFKVKKMIFVAHGYQSSESADWMIEMKDKLLLYTDYTVVLVGWSKGASSLNYGQSAHNCKVVGGWLGRVIDKIKVEYKNLNIHCIGHSLGAHLMGFAGKQSKIDRITGLDPAGPCFQLESNDHGLDKTDAKFVDCIHTDGDGTAYFHFGTLVPLGHIDFYPNYGHCESLNLRIDNHIHLHSLATRYFIDTISDHDIFTTSSEFKHKPRDNWMDKALEKRSKPVVMGYMCNSEYVNKEKTNCFFVRIDDTDSDNEDAQEDEVIVGVSAPVATAADDVDPDKENAKEDKVLVDVPAPVARDADDINPGSQLAKIGTTIVRVAFDAIVGMYHFIKYILYPFKFVPLQHLG